MLNENKIRGCIGLDFCTESNNSAGDWGRLMQFCRNVASHYWK